MKNKLNLSPEEVDKLVFRKSTRSGPNCDNCVEVAPVPGGGAVMRDSKDPNGPKLFFDAGEMKAFIDGAKGGEFD